VNPWLKALAVALAVAGLTVAAWFVFVMVALASWGSNK
jgi:hypothetical protein